jgi:phosphoadenosine phosphosulfate reductase
MLIITNRHTKKDIDTWDKYEKADLIHYENTDMETRERKAIEAIQGYADDNTYISVSWGRDSITALHLCYRAKIKVKIVSFVLSKNCVKTIYDYNLDAVRDKYFALFGKADYSEIEYNPEANLRKMPLMRKYSKGKKRITGVRKDESGIRKKSAKQHGVATPTSCRPIIYWKHQDVFAYIAKYGLPLHPSYGMTGGGRYDRFAIRVDGAFGGPGGTTHGRETWEREYYQDEYNRIASCGG